MNVVIDGIEYVPKCEHVMPSSARILACVKELVSIQYFNEKHKNRAVAWDALNALDPNLAKLCSDDPQAAYELMNPEED